MGWCVARACAAMGSGSPWTGSAVRERVLAACGSPWAERAVRERAWAADGGPRTGRAVRLRSRAVRGSPWTRVQLVNEFGQPVAAPGQQAQYVTGRGSPWTGVQHVPGHWQHVSVQGQPVAATGQQVQYVADLGQPVAAPGQHVQFDLAACVNVHYGLSRFAADSHWASGRSRRLGPLALRGASVQTHCGCGGAGPY